MNKKLAILLCVAAAAPILVSRTGAAPALDDPDCHYTVLTHSCIDISCDGTCVLTWCFVGGGLAACCVCTNSMTDGDPLEHALFYPSDPSERPRFLCEEYCNWGRTPPPKERKKREENEERVRNGERR